eukprot:5076367-Amphidinium_carterae.1
MKRSSSDQVDMRVVRWATSADGPQDTKQSSRGNACKDHHPIQKPIDSNRPQPPPPPKSKSKPKEDNISILRVRCLLVWYQNISSPTDVDCKTFQTLSCPHRISRKLSRPTCKGWVNNCSMYQLLNQVQSLQFTVEVMRCGLSSQLQWGFTSTETN